MKNILSILKIIVYFVLFESFHIKQSSAFLPRINEPNKQELKSSAIQIGKTAIQLIQFNQNEEAIRLLKLAVKLSPKEIQLWTSLSEAQFRIDRNLEALESLNKALKLQPNEPNIYFRQASIYMNLDDPEKAKISIKKGLLINKNNERGYFQLGNVEIMLKNYNLALDAFKKSSKINPKFWQSINNEGLVLFELDNYKKAITKFRSAIKLSDDSEPMLALAIVLYSSNNQSLESLKLAKTALKANPKYVLEEYQAKQLWGKKLQKSAQLLFKNKDMKKVVEEAKERTQ